MPQYLCELEKTRDKLKGRFTQGEISLLAEVCAGTVFQAGSIRRTLVTKAEEAAPVSYQSSNVDQDGFLSRLRNLTNLEPMLFVNSFLPGCPVLPPDPRLFSDEE